MTMQGEKRRGTGKPRGRKFTDREVSERQYKKTLAVRADDERYFVRTTKQRGEVAESIFMTKALTKGFGVAKPWGDSERYDFILDSGTRLWRVQVKSTYKASQSGAYRVHVCGAVRERAYTKEEIDVLVAYAEPEDVWYVVPVAALGKGIDIALFPNRHRRASPFEQYREAWGWLFEKTAKVDSEIAGGDDLQRQVVAILREVREVLTGHSLSGHSSTKESSIT